MECENCGQPPVSSFTWPTSEGVISANLCYACAMSWWEKYKNTNAGMCLNIAEPKDKK